MMKTRMIGIGWMTVILCVGQLAGGQEDSPMPRPENPMFAIEVQNKQLDLEQRRAELNFENEMRNIQEEKSRLELNHQRQMMQGPEQRPGPGKEGWHGQHFRMKHCLGFMLLCFVVHILLSIWVYQDIRRRNAGSGIWIVVTLLTGLLGVLVYAIVRLGDKST